MKWDLRGCKPFQAVNTVDVRGVLVAGVGLARRGREMQMSTGGLVGIMLVLHTHTAGDEATHTVSY